MDNWNFDYDAWKLTPPDDYWGEAVEKIEDEDEAYDRWRDDQLTG